MLFDRFHVRPVAGKAVGLGQHDEVLMAIQVPHDFVVADSLEIEIRHAPEISQRARELMAVIPSPVDSTSEVDRAARQSESALQDVVGNSPDFARKAAGSKLVGDRLSVRQR